MARVRVELESFITAWEASNSVKEVAGKLGIKVTSVMARASKYRGTPYNIPLKAMAKSGAPKLDVSAAKELLAKLRGTTIDTINTEATAIAAKQVARKAKADAKAAAPVNTNPFSAE